MGGATAAMDTVPVATYWADEPNLIREWEIDYEQLVRFDRTLNLKWQALFCFGGGLALPFLCCTLDNIRDADRAQHVAITRDGIRYSVDKHKTCCRCDCLDEGKVTKTVPFDKITDCDIHEPGGSSGPICCLEKNVIYTVVVDTASSGSRGEGPPTHELEIRGLRDPKGFKEMVWQMKRVSCATTIRSGPIAREGARERASARADVASMRDTATDLALLNLPCPLRSTRHRRWAPASRPWLARPWSRICLARPMTAQWPSFCVARTRFSRSTRYCCARSPAISSN
jgi:hypothetical protein